MDRVEMNHGYITPQFPRIELLHSGSGIYVKLHLIAFRAVSSIMGCVIIRSLWHTVLVALQFENLG